MTTSIQTIEQAIESHKAWLDRLNRAIQGEAETPSAKVIGDDSLCQFGRWLRGAEVKRDLPTHLFESIGMHHKLFHIHAQGVVMALENGRTLVTVEREMDSVKRLSGLLISLLKNALRVLPKATSM